MRIVDLETWPRRGAFELFRTYANPFFNVCVPLEAGALLEFVRARPGVSFATACLYLALRTARGYEPFRYRLRDGGVVIHDELHAGTATLAGGELAFMYFAWSDHFPTFQENARRDQAEADAGAIDPRHEVTDLIYFSTLPWIAFTGLTHARSGRADDSVPRVTFGRYHASGGQVVIPIAVEVHHALMDGLHVGVFLDRLQAAFRDPAASLPGLDAHP
jgi:chloramphenicol O-acetyltransferase type A